VHGNVLIDCGASSMIAIRKWGVDPNAISTVLVSHLHGDHFGGLPFFLLDASLISRRTAPLTLAGPPGFSRRLGVLQETMFTGSSEIERRYLLDIRELTLHERAEIEGLTVTPYLMKHYSGAPSHALRIETEGKVLAYSGDTEWVDELIPAAKDADLFICEAYFFDKAMKYHIDYATLMRHLPEIGARRTIVTHMSAELLSRRSEIALEAAEDGLVVEF
jgi:ribonuclease BN (tRNA processing enzyme)